MNQQIRQLSLDVANKIAAGEVVERPASVVKELVENAIDAGATRIEISCTAGGKEKIQVTDNGHGIRAAEAALAWERHATSKISDTKDLFCIRTLGFRGEALPSIAAVSDVQMLTRHHSEEMGTYLELRAGRVVAQRPQMCPVGTTITVNNLFYNTPARYKFLKSTASERRYIIDLVSHLALSNHQVAFRLVMDDEQVLFAQGTGKLSDAVLAVYGAEVASKMLPVEHRLGPYGMSGLIGRPEIARGNRSFQSLFVNGRFVQDSLIRAAVEKAYRELLPVKRFPVVVLNLTVPPDMVDVNVHPAKAEVRFKDESQIFRLVIGGIQRVFQEQQLIRPFELAPYQPPPKPSSPAQRAMDYGASTGGYVMRDKNPIIEEKPVEIPKTPEPAGTPGDLTVVGQLWDTYILIADRETLWLIDQHAAAERIHYDKLKAQWARSLEAGLARQALVVPIPLDPPLAQGELIREQLERLGRLGFVVEPFGQASFLVREIPVALEMLRSSPKDVEAIIEELVQEIQEEDWENRALASIACRAALKANYQLERREMLSLVQRLKETANPYTCPHGRPVLLELSRKEVEKNFARR